MKRETEVGMNHSGMQAAPDAGEKMLENMKLTKPKRGDERDLARIRTEYARQADPVGTLPEPKQSGMSGVLMDKLGARLAFERAGTRLYDALIAKCQADTASKLPLKELQHIRDDEATHFALVGAAIQSLGGDHRANARGECVRGRGHGLDAGHDRSEDHCRPGAARHAGRRNDRQRGLGGADRAHHPGRQ
jgi:hypothetical protein